MPTMCKATRQTAWDLWSQKGKVSQRKWYRDLSVESFKGCKKQENKWVCEFREDREFVGGSKLKGTFSCWKWWVNKLSKDCFLRTTNQHQATKRKQEATEDQKQKKKKKEAGFMRDLTAPNSPSGRPRISFSDQYLCSSCIPLLFLWKTIANPFLQNSLRSKGLGYSNPVCQSMLFEYGRLFKKLLEHFFVTY